MAIRYRYEGCRYPFPHRITGDGYERLMHGPLGVVESTPFIPPDPWGPAYQAARQLRAVLRAEGRLLEPAKRALSTLQEKVFHIIEQHPNCTPREISQQGVHRPSSKLSRCLLSLKTLGYIEVAGNRLSPSTGRLSQTWHACPRSLEAVNDNLE